MNDDDLAARLRAADPAASLAPADPGRVERLLEDTMSTDTDTGTPPQGAARRRNPLVWLASAAAVVIVAGLGFALLANSDPATAPTAHDRTTTSLTQGGGAQGRCMAPDAVTLAQAQTAFSGEVTSVEDGLVTLRPDTWYAGEHTDLVTVKQIDPGMSDLILTVDFEVGKTYLVAANNGHVMICGFSGEQSPGLSTLYQQAFPSSDS